jgi:hypothetical protein
MNAALFEEAPLVLKNRPSALCRRAISRPIALWMTRLGAGASTCSVALRCVRLVQTMPARRHFVG